MQHEHPPAATRQQRAVLLLHLGMPDAPDSRSVRRYTARVLGDPEVTRLPSSFRQLTPAVGSALSFLGAKQRVQRYQSIWKQGDSPLRTIAQEQAAKLQSTLPGGMQVFAAMRYGRPGITEVLQHIGSLGIQGLVAVSMFPQYSTTTTLTIVRELYRHIHRSRCSIDVTTRSIWYDDISYINAQSKLIYEFAKSHNLTPDNTHLVFSLRSLQLSCVDRGDPYMDHIHRTAELVSRRLGWPGDRISTSYQDHPESQKWLSPATSEVLADLSRNGEKQVLVCPLSYTTDCLETLEKINIRLRAQFEQDGGKFFVCPALNTYEPFIAALRNLVLHGRHPVNRQRNVTGLITQTQTRDDQTTQVDTPIESLIMVGMTLGGRLDSGQGPGIVPTDSETFRQIKRTQCDVPDLLRSACESDNIHEAWIWNTCRRFEFYGWLKDSMDEAAQAEVVSEIRQQIFSPNGQVVKSGVNILHGIDAWRHLMRTSAGLNSNLPGEREILQQLDAAHRLAERAGTAGPMTEKLLADISQYENDLREQTEWSRFGPNYCYASLSGVSQSTGLDLASGRHVIIGGSTTSCGILDTLVERYDVPRRQLTLLHRGHSQGGRLAMLRRAIGNGRRLRVHKYNEKLAIRSIAGADVVFIGLDRKEPILEAENICECRDFSKRPLTIIDYNMFGSTCGLENIDGIRVITAEELDAAADAFADELCSDEQFGRAVNAVESWINEHVPPNRAGEVMSTATER